MAREYGKVLMSAWTDPDFCALPRRAQGTYFFLTSQSDLNRAGVITMALNRWASRCEENDKAVILNDLATLARGRFIVVDEAEEEVLVRSFIRNDEGWKSPNIMVAVGAAARQISSETLRAVIAKELAKIDTSGLPLKVSDKTGRSTKDFVEMVIADAIAALSACVEDGDVLNWGTLSGTLPETLSRTLPDQGEKGTLPGTLSGRVPRGFPTTTTPETEPETTTETETSPSAFASTDEDFATFWDVYDKKEGRKTAHAKWRLAIKKPGVTSDLLIRAASEYIAYQRGEGKHPEYTKLPTTWLNGEHWNDERAARQQPRSPAAKSTTDERVQSTLAIAQRLREQEQAQQPRLRAIGDNR